MIRKFKVVCCSGYFDPLHTGHINYLRDSKLLGDKLVIILNNDSQHTQKSKIRTPVEERKVILESIKYVDEVVISIDTNSNICQTLKQIQPTIFSKGTCPSNEEKKICEELSIEVVENVGGMMHMQDLLSQFR
tara:strand:+ start:136 stop:534 length:399 start_codon:yes stop_codon:yes gene_type:complete